MKNLGLIAVLAIFFASCSKNIEKIEYGHDACDFCSMTIVDNTHAAQVVTDKGRNYKFDATECMINWLADGKEESEFIHILSADYYKPGQMIDATEATFIISENIPSPMGAYLSAVSTLEVGEELQSEFGGKLYNWTEIKQQIRGGGADHSDHDHDHEESHEDHEGH